MNLSYPARRIAILTVLAASATFASAQAGGEFRNSMAENSQKLKQYTYLQKTEVYLKGELKSTKLDQVHYDATTGEKVTVPLTSPPPEQSGRRLGHRMVEKKKDEMKEYVERLVGMMGQYLPPNPDRVKAAWPRAQITPPSNGVAKIALNGYLKPGDVMNLSFNTETKHLTQILVNSKLDDDPVSYLVSFSTLPDGTNYPALTSIQSQAKNLEIRVKTSDYHK